jgi:predicted outer membrane repeat protein
MRTISNLCCLVAMALWAAPAGAKTLVVDPTQPGGGNFSTISGAVSAANNGDTIEVAPGTYVESVELNGKIVKLIAVEGPTKTKLSGAPKLLQASPTPAAGTLVEGFTFEGASEGAVRISAASITLRGNVFTGNGASANGLDGGALWIAASPQATLEDNVFTGNQAERGGALYADSSKLLLDNNTFTGNSAESGGAAFIEGASDVVVQRLFACDNSATGGGALTVVSGKLEVLSGHLLGNTADQGGALLLDAVLAQSGDAVMLGNLQLIDNTAAQGGASIYLASTQAELVNAIFASGVAGDVWGDAASGVEVSFSAFIGDPAGQVVIDAAQAVDVSTGLLQLAAAADLMLRGDFEGSSCVPGAYEPLPGAPVVDTGAPYLKDPDGSRSNMGAYGGAKAAKAQVDTDDDGFPDLSDNCPDDINANQKDTDGDGIGDVCDPTPGTTNDNDTDGVINTDDNCPNNHNPNQADNDNDGIGDVCDANDDNDPIPDNNDCAPFDENIYVGAPEICNGIDDDCDQLIDEDLTCQPDEPDTSGGSDGEGGEPDASGEPDAQGGEGGGSDGGCQSGGVPLLPGAGLLILLACALATRRRDA